MPRVWGSLTRSLLTAYVETSRSCDTASRAWTRDGVRGCILGDGTFHVRCLFLLTFLRDTASRVGSRGVNSLVVSRPESRRSHAPTPFATVVAKLGFKPSFIKQGETQGPLPPSLAPVTLDHPWSSDVFRQPCDKVPSHRPWLQGH